MGLFESQTPAAPAPETIPADNGGSPAGSDLAAATVALAAEHQTRRGPGRPRKNPEMGATPGPVDPAAAPEVLGQATIAPADLELIKRTLATVLNAGDETLGDYIEAIAARVMPDKSEVAKLLESRCLSEPQKDLLSEQGAIVLIRWGLNSDNMPGLICGAILAIYSANNLRVINQLKAMVKATVAKPTPKAEPEKA